MNMMANAVPYAGPYSQSAGQALPGAGLGSQLQNKASMPNSMLNQFNVDKKALPGMVSFCLLRLIEICSHLYSRFGLSNMLYLFSPPSSRSNNLEPLVFRVVVHQ